MDSVSTSGASDLDDHSSRQSSASDEGYSTCSLKLAFSAWSTSRYVYPGCGPSWLSPVPAGSSVLPPQFRVNCLHKKNKPRSHLYLTSEMSTPPLLRTSLKFNTLLPKKGLQSETFCTQKPPKLTSPSIRSFFIFQSWLNQLPEYPIISLTQPHLHSILTLERTHAPVSNTEAGTLPLVKFILLKTSTKKQQKTTTKKRNTS